jgi:hypothetical protein
MSTSVKLQFMDILKTCLRQSNKTAKTIYNFSAGNLYKSVCGCLNIHTHAVSESFEITEFRFTIATNC